MVMKKLVIVTTHPIQYNAPWFKLLAQRNKLELKVFYTWSQAAHTVKDKMFERDITWDVPLLEGYAHEFVENVSKDPGSHHFFGIDCPSLLEKITKEAPDAILFFGWRFKSHLRAIRHFNGKVPIWFRGDSTLLDEKAGFKTQLRRLVLKQVYRYVDKAFYVGQANKDYFLKHGLNESQLVYAPHAVDNDHFTDDDNCAFQKDAKKWRQDLEIAEHQITVVFAGKFENKKQPNVLIDAVIEVNKGRTTPIVLVMIGNGPLEDSLKKKAHHHRYIKFIPFQNQSQMPIVYRLGSVFCLPSKGPGETWGLAINEAMASSTPVIVTDKVGGAKDMVVEGYNGYSFSSSSPEELKALLKNLSLEQLQIMAKNAKDHVAKFSLLQIVEVLEKEINVLIKKE